MRGCCNGVASQEKEINYDQHNAASPLYSFFKQPIINTLKKILFQEHQTSSFKPFFARISPPRRRFFGRALWRPNTANWMHLTYTFWKFIWKFFLAAFLKKRISTLITTGKQHKVLIHSWRNAFDVYSLEAHLEVFFLLRSLRNAHRRWLRLENNTKF